MERPYLLTYQNSDGLLTYGWFQLEDEMNDFINENIPEIKVIDKVFIREAYDLD